MDVIPYDPQTTRLRILFATSELFPLAKTGGLGDACAALPVALAALGSDVRAILPGYVSALDSARGKRRVARLAEGGTLLLGHTPDTGVPVYLLDWPKFYRRPGGPYQDQDKRDWPDNLRRFAAFSAAAAALARHGDAAGWQPDVVHANDWHTGLLPALLALHRGRRPATLFTIHNLAYQGNFPLEAARALGLPEAWLTPDGAEFYGQFSALKAGLRYADRLTTVSPTYAREILTPAFGAGMDGLLRARAADLTGILNGIDTDLWNPAADPALPVPFDADHLAGKAMAKAVLRAALRLDPRSDGPLVIGVNRLTEQKMADVVLAALPDLLETGAQVVLHGEGDPALEAAFRAAAIGREGQLLVRIGYQEELAHRLNAAADIALTPARFEPCGLTTMYAMRYGALPVTRKVGGLADTVTDIDSPDAGPGEGTGFTFDDPTAIALASCVRRAVSRFHDSLAWRRTQRAAMARDFAWAGSARRYRALYDELVAAPIAPQRAAPAFLEAAE
ncbi:MAG: glycogen synthase GlgA [Acidibrevibacterium sp.]|uniref:glycogen synthase GlgA n=1 Tax=Acidibrevibacterium sp. TaxID=2606776 RepID=UPI003CFD709F